MARGGGHGHGPEEAAWVGKHGSQRQGVLMFREQQGAGG